MILLAFKSTSKKASLSFCFTFQFYELIVNLQKWFFYLMTIESFLRIDQWSVES
jgi:hypothetical protein